MYYHYQEKNTKLVVRSICLDQDMTKVLFQLWKEIRFKIWSS